MKKQSPQQHPDVPEPPRYKTRIDLEDGLAHVRAQLVFMTHVCTGMLSHQEEDGTPGEEIIYGMYLIYSHIEEEVKEIGEALEHIIK